ERARAGQRGTARGGGEAVQAVEQVVGVRAGGVEADDEGDGAVGLGDVFQALAEQGVAGGRLREGQFGGGGVQVVPEAGGVRAVARRVDADGDAARRLWGGSGVW